MYCSLICLVTSYCLIIFIYIDSSAKSEKLKLTMLWDRPDLARNIIAESSDSTVGWEV